MSQREWCVRPMKKTRDRTIIEQVKLYAGEKHLLLNYAKFFEYILQ